MRSVPRTGEPAAPVPRTGTLLGYGRTCTRPHQGKTGGDVSGWIWKHHKEIHIISGPLGWAWWGMRKHCIALESEGAEEDLGIMRGR
jgi:hypothetical protein